MGQVDPGLLNEQALEDNDRNNVTNHLCMHTEGLWGILSIQKSNLCKESTDIRVSFWYFKIIILIKTVELSALVDLQSNLSAADNWHEHFCGLLECICTFGSLRSRWAFLLGALVNCYHHKCCTDHVCNDDHPKQIRVQLKAVFTGCRMRTAVEQVRAQQIQLTQITHMKNH